MPPKYGTRRQRREFLLRRLRQADGIGYDDLVAAVVAAVPGSSNYWTSVLGVKSVRELLWDELATVDDDGSIWLLPTGWQAAEKTA